VILGKEQNRSDSDTCDTDVEWEKWGARDPYYGVLTHDRFRSERMTADAYRDFFETGRGHVREVLASCRRYFGTGFEPRRVLDFGCGVGRLLIPFSEVSSSVVGVDISDSMLAEARRNCARFGVTNAEFVRSDDELSAVKGRFDLVHSAIVLQHIESAERGLDIIARMVSLILPGGVAAIHVTYGRNYGRCRYGRVIPDPAVTERQAPTLFRRFTAGLSRYLQTPVGGHAFPQIDAHVDRRDPVMLMYHYDLSQIAFILQNAGAPEMHAQFTNHGGELGVIVYAQIAKSASHQGDVDPPAEESVIDSATVRSTLNQDPRP
jgi:SAM-dependent methyltransferase